jgi:GNAT superfamily N-acetyltransferase
MLEIHQVNTLDVTGYSFIEQLMAEAFPPEERRGLELQRLFTDNNPLFFNNLLLCNKQPVGLMAFWRFEHFFFIEHFAIKPDFRNQDLGTRFMQMFLANVSVPVILEVELPVNELSGRRVSFYERAGFKCWTKNYFQPPYQKNSAFLPLWLMKFDSVDSNLLLFEAKKLIYSQIYLLYA